MRNQRLPLAILALVLTKLISVAHGAETKIPETQLNAAVNGNAAQPVRISIRRSSGEQVASPANAFVNKSAVAATNVISATRAVVNHTTVIMNAAAAETPLTGLQKAMALLEQTPTGKQALLDAKNLKLPIQPGKISKTEITATRTTNKNSNQNDSADNLVFNTQVLVAVDKEPVFQALDLAHELVHATHPKGNPFDPNLNAEDYVRHGIEGEGGEAPAIAQECKVGKELIANAQNEIVKTELKEETAQLIKARCDYVWKMENNERQWNQSFYYLGQYYHDFLSQVRRLKGTAQSKAAWADKVESKSPMFASAVAHKPYPLALLEEYVQITRSICEKSMHSRVGREIAAIAALDSRCHSVEDDVQN